MSDAPEGYDVIVTRKPWPDEPAPFLCVICQRVSQLDRWRPRRAEPPICFSCSNYGGHQVRLQGITRGDHHVLQRLKAITDELFWTAKREARRGRGLAL